MLQENLITIFFFSPDLFERRCSNSDGRMEKEQKACCMARNLITSPLTARPLQKKKQSELKMLHAATRARYFIVKSVHSELFLVVGAAVLLSLA